MDNFYRQLLSVFFIFLAFSCLGQNELIQSHQTLEKNVLSSPEIATLYQGLKSFELVKLDGSAMKRGIRENGTINTRIELPYLGNTSLFLERSELFGKDYELHTSSGNVPPLTERVIPLKGVHGPNALDVRLSVNDGFVKGFFNLENDVLYVQALSDFLPNRKGVYILYKGSDVIVNGHHTCGVAEASLPNQMKKHREKLSPSPDNPEVQASMVQDCYRYKVATASDWLFFQSNGGTVVDVENELTTLFNNTQTNYDDEFDDALIMEFTAMFVVDQSGGDPWTPNTDPAVLLPNFRSWGNGGGFGTQDYATATLWSGRNFDGSVIGLAYVGVICNNLRYNVVEDFSNNYQLLRVLLAHELGHNWSSGHDSGSSPHIMRPSVQNTTTWSNNSQSAINSEINSNDPPTGCLEFCPPMAPVEAKFSSDITNVCTGGFVQFFDLSLEEPTQWNWTFTGGSPSSSTDQHPRVQYNSPGTFEVILEAMNPGSSDIETKTGYITVGNNGTSTILFEDFESGFGDWTTTGNNGVDWEINSTIAGPGTQSATLKHFDNSNGDVDELISPEFSSVGYISMSLNLTHAYTTQNSREDSLSVYVSTDGGQNYSFAFGVVPGNNTVKTRDESNSDFAPAESVDWCFDQSNGFAPCLNIDLSAYTGSYHTVIKIKTTSANGNNLYIDQLSVHGDCYELFPPEVDFTADQLEGCAPLVVEFTDQSTNFPQTYNWTFIGGTPSSSTEQNPIVTYNDAGEYTVTLEVTNPAGTGVEVKQDYIIVQDVPIADFTETITGTTVEFTNLSQNADSYLWDFGDGGSSTEENPIHHYASGGLYFVTLTAFNICGETVIQREISIESAPIAEFTYSPTEGCEPLDVQFTDLSTGADTWNWTFEGGTPSSSTEQNPLVTYMSPGIYDVTLTVENSIGSDTFIWEDAVLVLESPSGDFTETSNGLTVDFDATADATTDYLWDFGDGANSTEEDPSHTYAAPGDYDVVLTLTGVCGSVDIVHTVTVVDVPTPEFEVDIQNGCVSLTVQFTDLSQGVDSWSWTFEGGTPATSNEQNPTVVYHNVGSFDVTLEVTNSQGTETLHEEDYIVTTDVPNPSFSVSVSDLDISTINNTTGANSYLWDFGDGNTSTDFEPEHTYASDGTYTVTLEATNACGTEMTTQNVSVGSFPNAGFNAPVTEGCVPFEVEYENLSSQNADTYAWTFEGGTPAASNEETPTVNYSSSGVFDVTLIVENTTGADTLYEEDYITVGEAPDADFDYSIDGQDVDFMEMSSSNTESWFWDFGDGETSTEQNPSHNYAEGAYTVMLITSNSCGSDTITKVIDLEELSAGFSIDIGTGCAPVTVNFTDESSSGASSWNWIFEGGDPENSTDKNPAVTYDEKGVYDVWLVVGEGGEFDTLIREDYIEILDVPEANFNYTLDGDIVSINNTTIDADSYFWDLDNGNTSTEDEPEFDLNGDEEVTIILIATNACGSDTMELEVRKNAAPVAGFSSDLKTTCMISQVQYENLSSGIVDSYFWEFEGGTPATSTEENPLVEYESTGRYDVSLTVTNSNGDNTMSIVDYISVIDVPIADFEFVVNGRNVEFNNTSTFGQEFYWTFGEGSANNQRNTEHSYPNENGTYTVTLFVENICGKDTISKEVEIRASAIGETSAVLTKVYPNPFKDEVFISREVQEPFNIRIYSVEGVEQMHLKSLRVKNITLSTARLQAGMYMLVASNSQGRSQTVKLIKQ